MSHVFDDSDDEFEDEYLESNKIIGKIEKQLNQKRKDSDERDRNEEIRKAVEIETKRIYNDLQRALKRTEKRKAPPVEVEKPPQKRRQIIKTEVRLSCDNETGVQVNEIEEVVISEEFDALIQSDDGDDSNELNDNENERDYTDIVDYIPTEEDEQEEDDDEEDEYELPKTRPRRENKNETRPSETNYTVLESGDIALSTELVDVGEFPESEGKTAQGATRGRLRSIFIDSIVHSQNILKRNTTPTTTMMNSISIRFCRRSRRPLPAKVGCIWTKIPSTKCSRSRTMKSKSNAPHPMAKFLALKWSSIHCRPTPRHPK